ARIARRALETKVAEHTESLRIETVRPLHPERRTGERGASRRDVRDERSAEREVVLRRRRSLALGEQAPRPRTSLLVCVFHLDAAGAVVKAFVAPEQQRGQ